MAKILITGANGLLGQKLVYLLSKETRLEICATGRGPSRIDFGPVSYLNIDLANREEVLDQLLKCAPTHIVHAAAMTQVDDCERDQERCWRNNVIATENLIEAAKRSRAYFQYISTDFIFDGFDGPYKEEDHPNPINYYGKSKLQGEALVMQSGLQCSIVRTVLVYGVGQDLQRSNLVLWVRNKLENGEKIRVVDDQWRNPTLVEDLALGSRLILEKAAHGIYNIAGKEYLTPFDIAMKTADYFELDKNLISPTNAVEFREEATRPLKTGFIIAKARENLGYEPVTLERGLQIVKEQLANLEKIKHQ